jgi:16S rRNA (guanine1207-N2)-methyltransferase
LTDLDFGRLRRFPDVEAANLFAYDATDRLVLDEARSAIEAAAPGEVVIIGDHYGALTVGALALGARDVRVFQDGVVAERALAGNAGEGYSSHALGAELLAGARVVIAQLPRSLDELDDLAAAIASHADPAVVVFAGGRVKHMTIAMNAVLGRHFATVAPSLARQKSRVLIAREPLTAVAVSPQREFHEDLGLWVCAYGGVFAGTKIDIGTRLLLSVLDQALPIIDRADVGTAIDLGCGTGILAAALARSRPDARVIATDQSRAAAASAAATMEANGLTERVTVVRDLGLETQPDGSADLILLNPPFHTGSTVHSGLAHSMFADAARVLAPGGELWTVYNSHLDYRQALGRIVGPTRETVRNAKFTVTASARQ